MTNEFHRVFLEGYLMQAGRGEIKNANDPSAYKSTSESFLKRRKQRTIKMRYFVSECEESFRRKKIPFAGKKIACKKFDRKFLNENRKCFSEKVFFKMSGRIVFAA